MSSPNSEGVYGQQQLGSGNSEYSTFVFIIQQMLAKLNTATLVKVVAVHGGGLSPVGTVDVSPLVNQVDGEGQPISHGSIFGLPYLRIQGGVNALVIDPAVGDIGFCVFCSRDISAVKASGVRSNPGSYRQFDMSDGLYFGGWNLGAAPSRYIRVSDSGIDITTPDDLSVSALTGEVTIPTLSVTSTTSISVVSPQVTITSPSVTVTGDLLIGGTIACSGGGGGISTFTGDFKVVGAVEVTQDLTATGTSVHTHKHGDVQTGTDQTGVPV